MAHEQHEYVTVGVRLRQREVNLSFGAESSYNGDPRINLFSWNCGWRRWSAPYLPGKVGLVDEGLVHVDDPLARL